MDSGHAVERCEAAASRPRRVAFSLGWIAAIGLAVAQARHFTAGFRLTADDLEFHLAFLNGFPSISHHAWHIATVQGKIGHLALVPLNAVGDYYADIFAVRALIALLHFAPFLAAGFYVSAILRRNIALPLFLALIALHPLGYSHLPPTSYPMHFLALPVALFCRLLVIRLRSRPTQAPALEAIAALVLALCMLSNEYMLFVGAAMIGFEWAATWLRRRSDPTEKSPGLLRSRGFLADILAVSIAFASYGVFRLLNPSRYDGNNADGLGNVAAIFETVGKHILAGTVLPYLGATVFDNPIADVVLAACFGIGVFAVGLTSARSTRYADLGLWRRPVWPLRFTSRCPSRPL